MSVSAILVIAMVSVGIIITGITAYIGWQDSKYATQYLQQEVPRSPRCGATDWRVCEAGGAHVYRICNMPSGHTGSWHREYRGNTVFAESSGNDGPITMPMCEHMDEVMY